jgi:Tol biopolymer transport system component
MITTGFKTSSGYFRQLILLAAVCFGSSICSAAEHNTEDILSDPLVRANPILFVTRHQYQNEHGTEATMYQTGEINTHCFQGASALKTLNIVSGKVTTLLSSSTGVIRDPEVHFDGKKILFSMRKDIQDDYHLYEIDVDGSALKQLTFAPQVSDIQPIYLPDETIVFSSTRDPKYIPCQRHLMANLFKMNSDGSNIHQIRIQHTV